MTWCGRCFTVQTTSDFESEDDGEYEYFVNSRYICKRKKSTVPPEQTAKLDDPNSSLTEASDNNSELTSRDRSSSISQCNTGPSCARKEHQSPFESSEMNSSKLKDGRVWQVGHATVNNPSAQPFFDTSASDSDRTLEIVFDTPRREARSPSLPTISHDQHSKQDRAISPATTATSMVTIDRSPANLPRKKPGLMSRLFGRSEKLKSPSEYFVSDMESSLFKEAMELPAPAETTKTLYWTVRVKLK